MKKNECAQEMILDVVLRHGCEVKIRPRPGLIGNVIEIVFRHGDVKSAVTIDLEKLPYGISGEEIACRSIERAIADLFRYPYREMVYKRFHKEGE